MQSESIRPEKVSGQRMAEAREAARLSQVELAQLLKVDQTKVSRFELGKVPSLPSLLATIDDYCQTVGCDWTEILEPYFTPTPSKRRRLRLERAS